MKTLRPTSPFARNSLVVAILFASLLSPEIASAKARAKRFDRTAARSASGLKLDRATSKPPTINQTGSLAAATDADTRDKLRYDLAKAKAVNDPQVRALKTKADSALSDDQFRPAAIAYNKALFAKMRQIDRGAADWIDRVEAGVLRRIAE